MRTTAPLVSVIISTIKFDEMTSYAINSIHEQTYDNWELILVLDGADINEVPLHVIENPKIHIVEHEIRLGTPVSLNDGIDASKGDLIARLDADDLAHPDRLQYQVDFMQSNLPVGCLGTGGYLIDINNNVVGQMNQHEVSLDIRSEFLTSNALVHSSVMYRRDLFNEVGGYNPIMTRMQDYDLFLRMAQVSNLAITNELLCAYRTHPGQHSRKTSPFKRYTFEILKQRTLLSKVLHSSYFGQSWKNLKWYAAQVLRFSGVRKPGYLNVNDVPENELLWIEQLKPNKRSID